MRRFKEEWDRQIAKRLHMTTDEAISTGQKRFASLYRSWKADQRDAKLDAKRASDRRKFWWDR